MMIILNMVLSIILGMILFINLRIEGLVMKCILWSCEKYDCNLEDV